MTYEPSQNLGALFLSKKLFRLSWRGNFNPAKALRERGLPQTPPRQAGTEAVQWFRLNGFVKGG